MVDADYVGFDIPNEFVVGYGLDYNERYRNLPFIGVLTDEAIRRHDAVAATKASSRAYKAERSSEINRAMSQLRAGYG